MFLLKETWSSYLFISNISENCSLKKFIRIYCFRNVSRRLNWGSKGSTVEQGWKTAQLERKILTSIFCFDVFSKKILSRIQFFSFLNLKYLSKNENNWWRNQPVLGKYISAKYIFLYRLYGRYMNKVITSGNASFYRVLYFILRKNCLSNLRSRVK